MACNCGGGAVPGHNFTCTRYNAYSKDNNHNDNKSDNDKTDDRRKPTNHNIPNNTASQ